MNAKELHEANEAAREALSAARSEVAAAVREATERARQEVEAQYASRIAEAQSRAGTVYGDFSAVFAAAIEAVLDDHVPSYHFDEVRRRERTEYVLIHCSCEAGTETWRGEHFDDLNHGREVHRGQVLKFLGEDYAEHVVRVVAAGLGIEDEYGFARTWSHLVGRKEATA
jgi:vacuolar-type H+-ATPase subunit H